MTMIEARLDAEIDATPPAAVRRHGPAEHRRVRGIHVLRVAGSFREMGRQHGALLASEVKAGPIPYYRRMVERLLGKPFGPLSPAIATALQRLVGSRIERALPDFALETALGVAEGAGIPPAEFLRGCTMPDALVWLTARLQQWRDPGPAVAHRLALGLGCTSAIAWGAATRDGMLYHGRNFDYHGVENWPEHAAVVFHEPERGQRYVSVAAAGVALGGITAMNEAGLSLTVHQHMFTDRARLGGTPIGVVGDVVMREARSLDEAESILRRNKPIGCWTYLVTDARKREVLCFEENPERAAAHRIGPDGRSTFGYANIYLDPELGATEVNLYGSYWRHNQGRHRRVNELLGERAGRLDARGIGAILGDTGDPRCRVRDSIAMVLTVGSVVFRPEDGAFWIGAGRAPTSRGGFVPFSLEARGHAPDLGELEPLSTDAEPDAAFELYRRAYVAYVDRGDPAGARAHMEAAAAIAPAQSIYHALVGILSIELGEPVRARAALDRAIALGHPDEERVASFYLWRARAADLDGRRVEARADYAVCSTRRADPPVAAAARGGLERPYTARRARRIQVEMSLGDVMAP